MTTKYHVYGTRYGQEVILAVCISETIALAAMRGCDGWDNVRYESTDKRSYKLISATVHNTSGVEVMIAVKADKQSTEQDNASDLRTVAQIVTRLPAGAIRLHNVKPIKSVAGWLEVPTCTSGNDGVWAWHKVISIGE